MTKVQWGGHGWATPGLLGPPPPQGAPKLLASNSTLLLLCAFCSPPFWISCAYWPPPRRPPGHNLWRGRSRSYYSQTRLSAVARVTAERVKEKPTAILIKCPRFLWFFFSFWGFGFIWLHWFHRDNPLWPLTEGGGGGGGDAVERWTVLCFPAIYVFFVTFGMNLSPPPSPPHCFILTVDWNTKAPRSRVNEEIIDNDLHSIAGYRSLNGFPASSVWSEVSSCC